MAAKVEIYQVCAESDSYASRETSLGFFQSIEGALEVIPKKDRTRELRIPEGSNVVKKFTYYFIRRIEVLP